MGWLDAIESRSLENPNTPFSALFDAFGIRQSATGINVTPENSLEVSAVWAAVRMISSTMATMPLPVYQHSDNGKTKARSHPLYRLLHDRPNPETSSFIFRETLQAHLLLYGNAYAEIERNARGEPVALWQLHPSQVRIDRIDGAKVYIVNVKGADVKIPAENMLHIPGFSLDGHSGLVPISLMRNTIGLAKATEEYGSRFFSNNATPSGILSHPGKLGTESAEKLKKSWNSANGGLNNAQRIAVVEEGMKFTPMGIPPEHAQFLETRKFSIQEIARLFLIPPHLLADLERATFSNIEHQQIAFVVHCIEPWAKRWESILNYDLFDDSEYFAEFALEGLLRGDSASRAEFYTKLFNIGVFSPNDILAKENMNTVEGGDTRFVPLNMQPLSGANAPAIETVKEAARSLISAEVGRMERRKSKHTENRDDAELAILTENIGPTVRAYFQLTNRDEDPAAYIRALVADPTRIEAL